MSIKDPKHNRLYAIACLTDELANLRLNPPTGRLFPFFAHWHKLQVAKALYDMALAEEQWQEHERERERWSAPSRSENA